METNFVNGVLKKIMDLCSVVWHSVKDNDKNKQSSFSESLKEHYPDDSELIIKTCNMLVAKADAKFGTKEHKKWFIDFEYIDLKDGSQKMIEVMKYAVKVKNISGMTPITFIKIKNELKDVEVEYVDGPIAA